MGPGMPQECGGPSMEDLARWEMERMGIFNPMPDQVQEMIRRQSGVSPLLDPTLDPGPFHGQMTPGYSPDQPTPKSPSTPPDQTESHPPTPEPSHHVPATNTNSTPASPENGPRLSPRASAEQGLNQARQALDDARHQLDLARQALDQARGYPEK